MAESALEYSRKVSQPFLLLLGGILTYCAPGTRKVLNFVGGRVTRLGEHGISVSVRI